MRISPRMRGIIGLLLVTPVLAFYAAIRLWVALGAVSTRSIVAYVGYPGGPVAKFPFSAAERPFYFGMALLDYAAGGIALGGAALVVTLVSWRRLRNVPGRMFSSAQSASWVRFWIASFFAWMMLAVTFPILAFFSML